MTRTTAFLLALGFVGGALAYGGLWVYGDGFIFNRFTGTVIYVDLPEEEDAPLDAVVRGADGSRWHGLLQRPPSTPHLLPSRATDAAERAASQRPIPGPVGHGLRRSRQLRGARGTRRDRARSLGSGPVRSRSEY